MASPISGNYSQPVYVNGYQCWNCKAVAEAKKGIDPQNPKAGPYGIDAKNNPASGNTTQPQSSVTFGGALSGINGAATSNATLSPNPIASQFQLGNQINLSA